MGLITTILFVLTFATFQISCNNKPNKSAYQDTLPGTTKPVSDTLQSKRIDTIKVKNLNQILGTWITLSKEYLTVEIDKHSFYFREHNEKLKYKFDKDTISVFDFDNNFGGRPYFIKDTLLLLGRDGYCLKFLQQKK